MAELNFNAARYKPAQPEDELTDYAVWIELCQRMDYEAIEARNMWRKAIRERDEHQAAAKIVIDNLKDLCMYFESRQKPQQPPKVT